jgi:hypothetical protein
MFGQKETRLEGGRDKGPGGVGQSRCHVPFGEDGHGGKDVMGIAFVDGIAGMVH